MTELNISNKYLISNNFEKLFELIGEDLMEKLIDDFLVFFFFLKKIAQFFFIITEIFINYRFSSKQKGFIYKYRDHVLAIILQAKCLF